METTFENGTLITSYLACGQIEGFDIISDSMEDTIRAWSYLIGTGNCWSLQGSYGRAASSLIENEVISEKGIVNWELIHLNQYNNE